VVRGLGFWREGGRRPNRPARGNRQASGRRNGQPGPPPRPPVRKGKRNRPLISSLAESLRQVAGSSLRAQPGETQLPREKSPPQVQVGKEGGTKRCQYAGAGGIGRTGRIRRIGLMGSRSEMDCIRTAFGSLQPDGRSARLRFALEANRKALARTQGVAVTSAVCRVGPSADRPEVLS